MREVYRYTFKLLVSQKQWKLAKWTVLIENIFPLLYYNTDIIKISYTIGIGMIDTC